MENGLTRSSSTYLGPQPTSSMFSSSHSPSFRRKALSKLSDMTLILSWFLSLSELFPGHLVSDSSLSVYFVLWKLTLKSYSPNDEFLFVSRSQIFVDRFTPLFSLMHSCSVPVSYDWFFISGSKVTPFPLGTAGLSHFPLGDFSMRRCRLGRSCCMIWLTSDWSNESAFMFSISRILSPAFRYWDANAP